MLLLLIKLSLSQAIAIEVIGRDTFPLATTYHGIEVSAFTDKQTTSLAQIVNDNRSMKGKIKTYEQKEVQYEHIIGQNKLTVDTMQGKLNDAEAALELRKQNEDDLKKNLKDAAAKYAALQTKSNLRIGMSVVGSFLVGSGVGTLVGFFAKH